MEFGGLYHNTNTTAIGGIATGGWTTITNFSTNAPYNKVKPDHGIDKLETIDGKGVYFAFWQASFIGPANQEYVFEILKDGAGTGYQARRGLGASGTYDSVSIGGLVEVEANGLLSVGVRNVGGLTGTTLTVKDAQLLAFRVGGRED